MICYVSGPHFYGAELYIKIDCHDLDSPLREAMYALTEEAGFDRFSQHLRLFFLQHFVISESFVNVGFYFCQDWDLLRFS